MTKRLAALGTAKSTAVSVRLVAFVVAALSLLAIPATLLEAGIGHLPLQVALIVVGFAVALILIATFAVRSFDPLRG